MKRICKICQTEFNVYPADVKRGGGIYCSRKCQGVAHSEYMKNLPLEQKPNWNGGKIKLKCSHCETIIYKKQSVIKDNNFCSKSCANSFNMRKRDRNGSVLNCLVCGKEFYRNKSSIERIEKKPKYCSQACRAMDSVKHQRKTDTDIEIITERWLFHNQVDYEKQKIINGICIVDFFINPNICLFADGDYWHSLPKRVQKDKEQRTALVESGYKVISLLGSEILKGVMPDGLL